ncbi:LmbU family transcriptional regulator [Catenulispora subtropica]|uniref:Antibiotic biosynthesis protein n=1 Tax=Catenulispora subtropica TaxID=450798 RepID=A0ABP5DVR9_9ACTN
MGNLNDVNDKTVAPRRSSLDRLSRGAAEADTGNGVTLTGVSLQIPRELSYDAWERVGKQLNGVIDSSAWWLGDWLIFGKERYVDSYQQAIRAAGLSYQTLRNYAWVARRFAPAERRAQLTFQHHAEVVSLPKEVREKLLDQAEQQDWTTKQLRERVRGKAARPPRPAAARGAGAAGGTFRLPKIEVVHDQLTTWRRAADEAGHDFESWVVAALDRAAAVFLNCSSNDGPPSAHRAQATEGG